MRQTQEERRNRSERRLIEAAIDIVVESGVAAVTLDAIGSRAGYSRTLAPQKFGSKGGLVASVLDYLHEAKRASEQPVSTEMLTGMQALEVYVDRILVRLGNSPEGQAYFVFLAGAVADQTETRELFARAHERTKTELIALLEKGCADGSMRDVDDPEAAAILIGMLILGIAMQWFVNPETDLERISEQARALLRANFQP